MHAATRCAAPPHQAACAVLTAGCVCGATRAHERLDVRDVAAGAGARDEGDVADFLAGEHLMDDDRPRLAQRLRQRGGARLW